MEKVNYIEEKLIEATEIAMQAEKASAEAEQSSRKFYRELSIKIDGKGEKELTESRKSDKSLIFQGSKIEDIVEIQGRFEKFCKDKFSQIKLYMAESNEMLKHHSDLIEKNNLSSGEKIKESKREFIDKENINENIKIEVKKN